MKQPTDVATLFDGSKMGGVYRVIAPAAEVLVALRNAGWECGHVVKGDSKQEFLTSIGEALNFPNYYGKNLDALWDCLTDFTAPTALLWTSWHELAIDHPDDWAAIVDVLKERAAQSPAFALVLG